MKKLAKVLGVALAASMLLASCGGTASSSQAAASGGAAAGGAGGNADRENVSIRYAMFGNSLDDPDGLANDPIKKKIEELVNVSLEYDTGTDGFDDRMMTELATGTAPDLFPIWNETDKLTKWIDDEILVDMNAIVAAEPERYPTLSKIFNDPVYQAYNKLYSGDENKVYAIYGIAALPQPSFAGVPVYNTAALEQYNEGKVPATVQEFIDFTIKVGEGGEMAGWWPRNNKLDNWQEIDKTIADPQGTSIQAPWGDPWTGFIPDGEDAWKLMTVSEKSKEVVKQLAEMYAANGLHQGVGIRGDFDDAYAEFGASKIAAANFGFGYPNQFRDFYLTAWETVNPEAQMSDLTLGTALTADGNYGKTYSTYTWMSNFYMIPTSAAAPDRVLDLLEFFASDAGQSLLFKGIEGQTYTGTADPYSYDVEAWKEINKAYGYTEPDRARYVWFGNLFSGAEMRLDLENGSDWWSVVSAPYDNTDDWASDQQKELASYGEEIVGGFRDEVMEKLPAYYNMINLSSEAETIRTSMKEISNRYLTAMIGGQMDIETEWPNYVAEYENAGAADLERMVNEAIAQAKADYGE